MSISLASLSVKSLQDNSVQSRHASDLALRYSRKKDAPTDCGIPRLLPKLFGTPHHQTSGGVAEVTRDEEDLIGKS